MTSKEIFYDDTPTAVAANTGHAPSTPWAFTFGPDHRLLIAEAETGRPAPNVDGVSLHRRFVVIHGATAEEARSKMTALFGGAWCRQYDLTDPDVKLMLASHRCYELELTADE